MATRTVRLTQEGFDRLKANLAQEYVRLDEATKILRELTGSSDDYDDSGLEEAKQEKGHIENRIDGLEDQLARAEIITNSEHGRVDLGDRVLLRDNASGGELRVQVVAPIEAGVLEGEVPKVSDESPLGRALLGRKEGETVQVTVGATGKGKTYTIVAVG
ncbi:MAG: GreA/GreB family elongation factor [bacterium]|nr:GreA/GreB family elongation factor [bacterium]